MIDIINIILLTSFVIWLFLNISLFFLIENDIWKEPPPKQQENDVS